MYVELAALDKMVSEKQTRDAVFVASELHLNGIVVLPTYLSEMRQYTDDMVLATVIDFPHGTSDPAVRAHGVLTAIRNGANTIDLVINHSLVVNNKLGKLLSDIEHCLSICCSKKVKLRIMLEYRVYDSTQQFFEIIGILKDIGIEYIIPSTGHRLDNFSDNLICAHAIEELTGMKAISNGNALSKEQYETVKKTDIYGIRFTSIPVVKSIFGV